uniref:HMA domain-containing protein n=1 Tax=Aegilops tauschii subsp. strangulata TaxID=200361 RepID=A0A453JCW1_AEGTS
RSDPRTKDQNPHTISRTDASIDSIAADLKDNKMTVIGAMDTVAIAKRLKKLGKIDIVSVGPAKEEKKPAPAAEKKGEVKKDDKKEEKKDDKK